MITFLKILLVLLALGLIASAIAFIFKIKLGGPGGYKSKGPPDHPHDR